MYEELIKTIRHCVEVCDCSTCPVDNEAAATHCISYTLAKAADAIEELSMKLMGDEAAIRGMKREIEGMVINSATKGGDHK